MILQHDCMKGCNGELIASNGISEAVVTRKSMHSAMQGHSCMSMGEKLTIIIKHCHIL